MVMHTLSHIFVKNVLSQLPALHAHAHTHAHTHTHTDNTDLESRGERAADVRTGQSVRTLGKCPGGRHVLCRHLRGARLGGGGLGGWRRGRGRRGSGGGGRCYRARCGVCKTASKTKPVSVTIRHRTIIFSTVHLVCRLLSDDHSIPVIP